MSGPVNTGSQLRDVARALFAASDATGVALVDNSFARVRHSTLIPLQGTAATIAGFNLGVTDRQIAVQSVKLMPDAALTHDGTNNKVFTLEYDDGAAGSATAVGVVDTSANDWSANVPISLALTAANVVVPAGKQLRLKITKNGTGVATPNIGVEVMSYIV